MTRIEPQLPVFLNEPTRTVTIHATHIPTRRVIRRDNLILFCFFTALFAVIIAHAR